MYSAELTGANGAPLQTENTFNVVLQLRQPVDGQPQPAQPEALRFKIVKVGEE
jgi:hypothetical protein